MADGKWSSPVPKCLAPCIIPQVGDEEEEDDDDEEEDEDDEVDEDEDEDDDTMHPAS